MAGNIIPAIATTNAVIAGLIVLEGLKILSGKLDQCRTVSENNVFPFFIYIMKYIFIIYLILTFPSPLPPPRFF